MHSSIFLEIIINTKVTGKFFQEWPFIEAPIGVYLGDQYISTLDQILYEM
jgi:hypothetical protein